MVHGLQDSFQTFQQGGKVLFENGCHHLHVHAEVLVDEEIAGGHDLPPGDFGLKALEVLGNAPGRFTENLQKANQGEGRFLLGRKSAEVFALGDFQGAPAGVPHVQEPDAIGKATPPHAGGGPPSEPLPGGKGSGFPGCEDLPCVRKGGPAPSEV